MMLRRIKRVACVALGITLTGCMPKMTIEQMRETMPKKPAELKRLDMFVGQWDMEGEAKMAMLEEPIKVTGHGEGKWGGNGWFTVNRGVMSMEGVADMEMVETWTYDSKSKKYRNTWVDSMGTLGTGTARYDDKTDTWHFRASAHSVMGRTSMKGTAIRIDPKTFQWTWTEYAMGGLMKTMEMKGITHMK